MVLALKPDISEFSYGFALTSELISRFGLSKAGAPTFATQQAEAQPGGGWDAKLPGHPVFLQFKRSDYLKTRNAKEYSYFRQPYYRFKLRARRYSQQHDLLLQLESAGNSVFYAAPRFHRPDELNQAFAKGEVIARSVFVSPQKLGPIVDLEEHCLSFSPSGLVARFRSEPSEVELSDPFLVFDSELRRKARDLGRARFYRALGDELVDLFATRQRPVAAASARTIRTIAGDRDPADYAQFVAQTLFDCQLLIGQG